MRVLVACEFSGVVRDAFIARGHEAVSCDLLESEAPGPHIIGDALTAMRSRRWDLMIAHPPCRFLNHAGVRWLYQDGRRWIRDESGKVVGENPRDEKRRKNMHEAAQFFLALLNSEVPRVAIENSEMHPYAEALVGRTPDCISQPWEHGHGETKAICWWLKNLPPLAPSNIVGGRQPRVHHASPGPERWKERSRFLSGVAAAMAEQWGCATLEAAA